MSYFNFLTTICRSLRQTICSCIALHEFKSRIINVALIVMFEPVFPLSSPLPTSHALRVSSCKIDEFRSKDIHRLSNIMDTKTTRLNAKLYSYSSPFLQVTGVFFFYISWYIYNPRLSPRSPIYTHSLSFQFPIFLHAYLLALLYQRLMNPHPPLLS